VTLDVPLPKIAHNKLAPIGIVIEITDEEVEALYWRSIGGGRAVRLYFVKSGAYVKIGYASDLRSRVAGMHTDNPAFIRVIHSIPLRSIQLATGFEQLLLNKLRRFHHRGEWFRLSDKRVKLTIDLVEDAIERLGVFTDSQREKLRASIPEIDNG